MGNMLENLWQAAKDLAWRLIGIAIVIGLLVLLILVFPTQTSDFFEWAGLKFGEWLIQLFP
jgi:uncharacterized membrane protein